VADEVQSWQRPPFEPGNDAALKHGAYATVQLGERVDVLADSIRDLVPSYRAADEIAVRMLCLALARLERSAGAIDSTTDPTELGRLRSDERGWANTVRRYLNDLGLSPMSRAKLRLDVAVTQRVLTLTGLADAVEAEAAEIADGDAS
jgi:hypothetical protein